MADVRLSESALDRSDFQTRQQFEKAKKHLIENAFVVTAHCPNSGSMLECSEPGRPVYLSRHNSPKRKLKYTWEIIEMPTSLVGTNTIIPNKLVKAAIAAGNLERILEEAEL